MSEVFEVSKKFCEENCGKHYQSVDLESIDWPGIWPVVDEDLCLEDYFIDSDSMAYLHASEGERWATISDDGPAIPYEAGLNAGLKWNERWDHFEHPKKDQVKTN
jgi:hypothetical protein